ncbi:MAG: DUF3293 domain-containing protein [Gammaproteobacteria bacterium]|nr:DUF3293 domain-containing protein [Gammaproteobacteria bacterium]MCP5137526.1 DUF3293 domain-containing protein [Gammaproteobacteria bacterium]
MHTRYVVSMDGSDVELRIGQPLPGILSQLAQTVGTENAGLAVITACNPYSTPTPEDQNQARQAVLATLLGWHDAWDVFAAEGISEDGGWSEPSFLVVGIERVMAESIGRCFQQNAVVFALPGGLPELRCCI